MARVASIYPSFGRGEVSPHLYGRIDIEQYNSCLAKARNVIIRPYGEVSRVSGTQFIAPAKQNNKVRLLKFVFSATDSYTIECGAGYFRFYRNGALIELNGAPYEVANDYTVDQLDSIQLVQIDDIIKLVCERSGTNNTTNHPKELLRYGDTNWVFRDVSFRSTPYLEENQTSTTLLASAATGNITITASTGVFVPAHVGSFWRIGGTTTVDDVKKQGYVKITQYVSATEVRAEVQSKLSTTTATVDWAEGAWSDHRGWPTRIGLFDGRLYYARTEWSKRNVYASKPYAYETFTYAVDNEDNGALNIELATNATGDGSDIKWLIGSSYMLSGTYGGEFVVKGEGDSAITPSNITARQRSNMGSERVQPVMVGSYIHFIQRGGKKLRQFTYDYYTDSYNSIDMSLFSEHLFESKIIDIAFTKIPDGIVWLLREDGNIIAFTYDAEQQVQAWSLLEMGGKVESIESLPSEDGSSDELWMVVRRVVNGTERLYIEKSMPFTTPEIQQECWYVRCGLDYSAYDQTKSNPITLSAKTGQITISATSDVFNQASVGRRIRYFDKTMKGQAVITGFVDARTVSATVESDFESTAIEGGKWGISVEIMSAADHLEGETVQILADGAVQTDRVVENGSFRLEKEAWRVIAGLKYQSVIQTLPLEQGAENGTAMGKRKRIHELSLRVWRTLGVRVGRDLDNLIQVQFRNPNTQMGMPEAMFTGIIPNIKYNQGWVWEANITVEQSKPLPMNILAIAPICNTQDK